MLEDKLDTVKKRCGIAEGITVYDEEIAAYLDDCEQDLKASGVTDEVMNADDHQNQILTAATLYVKAYLGNDRTDTEKYLDLYRKKVFRLALEGDDGLVG